MKKILNKDLKYFSKHKMTKSPTYNTWQSMKSRCNYPNDLAYPQYGGRGITVCEKWNDFLNFYEDMGKRPNGFTLDRLDPNGNYCKENCAWADKKQQCLNKRNVKLYTIDGVTLNKTDWSKLKNIPVSTINARLKKNLSFKDAVCNPINSEYSGRRKLKKEKVTLCKQYCEEYKIFCSIKSRCIRYKMLCIDSFEFFIKEIGNRPSKNHSVDRINNNLGYVSGNMRWATKKEQAINRKTTVLLTIDNETLCLADWGRKAGVDYNTISRRLKKGWSHKDAVYGRSNL